ncbi:hypothetical protein EB796_008013 [Bugula neritina]|uniref:Guanylate-binding protein N-terminal domain-containing protein n=1 Tax=Bugula neritina TaxID=10212 RepID=A0A7J7K604_BUGNE|nr:hypothetical protein EB796_008013 [Bugula neritina]
MATPTSYQVTSEFQQHFIDPDAKPVEIVTFPEDIENGAPTFLLKRFRSILEKQGAKKLPVFIISITGVFRSGKSFLLNLMKTYLEYYSTSILSQSILSQSILSQSIISQSILSQSILSQPILSQSILSQSILSLYSQSILSVYTLSLYSQSILSQSILSQSILSQSILSQSILSQSILSQSILSVYTLSLYSVYKPAPLLASVTRGFDTLIVIFRKVLEFTNKSAHLVLE